MPKMPYQGREVDGIEVDFKIKTEDWNEYRLADGTEIREKTVVHQVFLLPGEYDAEGNPVYVVRSQNLLVVRAPDHLKKPREHE